jgi:hypothetical protein
MPNRWWCAYIRVRVCGGVGGARLAALCRQQMDRDGGATVLVPPSTFAADMEACVSDPTDADVIFLVPAAESDSQGVAPSHERVPAYKVRRRCALASTDTYTHIHTHAHTVKTFSFSLSLSVDLALSLGHCALALT